MIAALTVAARRAALAATLAMATIQAAAAPGTQPVSRASLTLDDLFSAEGVADVALSPSGQFVAAVIRGKDDDVLLLQDLLTGASQPLTRVDHKEVGKIFVSHITSVTWKSEDRVLFRVSISPAEGVSARRFKGGDNLRLGQRLFSIDRSGKGLVRLLARNRDAELDFAHNLGEIRSLLPKDPTHILMLVDGEDGRSLFKVDVISGQGEVVEKARPYVWDWWLDSDGNPAVLVELSAGTLRFYRREGSAKWKRFHIARLSELGERTDYEPVGPSNEPGKFYVIARPSGAQRRGVYLYDLDGESFGPPVAENPLFDIFAAWVADDGKTIQRYCYIAHVRVCESADPRTNVHMKAVRTFFNDSANVYVTDASNDGETLLLLVEGPNDPPAYYHYRFDSRKIELLGFLQEATADRLLPTASVVEYRARDGVPITGYLTRPPGAEGVQQLPLVVLPHGGPQIRDHLTFDIEVQYLASRGYAIFQPNFRGSDGFGQHFVDLGYGEWGRKMLDDITDGVAHLIEQKVIDPGRICIVGASYGGYSALAGAAFTPELYRCAASMAGVADLELFLDSRRKRSGGESEEYSYWKKQIGDPQKDSARIAAASPSLHVDRIKAAVLLVHGEEDQIVPYEQSELMKKRLDKSGRPTELITLENEGHSGWSSKSARRALQAVATFIEKQLGPGFSARTPGG